ncbi:hypothetical protein HNP38_003010 [Chryseobacterium defluvii]|uniref:Barstar (Barnase inhibitor) n=1 Tax=Chryseobacterium defluvii TaxID=160396 RepID=A0A840KJ39_9FLAO|nr:hypothetical protein [Chryseobacterium defluvii]MBB4807694.1 hypothetical protein [Chryseobacterium defluvii]
MKNLLKVSLMIDDNEFIRSNYIELIPFSKTSMRTVVFKNVKVINKHIDLLSGEYEFSIAFRNKNLDWGAIHWYSLYMITSDIFDKDIKEGDDICIESILTHNKHIYYDQDVIDVYNLWQNEKVYDWNSFDINFKLSYISACYIWCGLPKSFIRNHIILDCLLIKEQIDLFYYLGIEMFGERAYCGSGFYQFEDCILGIYAKNKEGLPSITFKNFNSIELSNIKEDIMHLVGFFKSLKLTLIFEN